MGRDVRERCVQRAGAQHLTLAAPDCLPPEAEAAIDRADARQLQEHAIAIAMNDAFDRRVAVVADRIRDFGRCRVELRFTRHELTSDCVVRLALCDQAADMRRDRESVAGRDRVQVRDPFRFDQLRLRQLFRGSQNALIHRHCSQAFSGEVFGALRAPSY
jgi:hypothetical protein